MARPCSPPSAISRILTPNLPFGAIHSRSRTTTATTPQILAVPSTIHQRKTPRCPTNPYTLTPAQIPHTNPRIIAKETALTPSPSHPFVMSSAPLWPVHFPPNNDFQIASRSLDLDPSNQQPPKLFCRNILALLSPTCFRRSLHYLPPIELNLSYLPHKPSTSGLQLSALQSKITL